MKQATVTLIDYTGKFAGDAWYAACVMIWTKRTRVEMKPGGLGEIMQWSEKRKTEELEYMAATIPSSHEFCDFTFLIQNVTRAFTHQLVRTRTSSFAQQNMSVQDVTGWSYHTGPTIQTDAHAKMVYDHVMNEIALAYDELIKIPGVSIEDARGVLPTNILTNITMKINLRGLADLLRKRASPRNQGARPGSDGEWTSVHRQIKEIVVDALPWTPIFLDRDEDKVAMEMYHLLEKVEDKLLKTDLTKRVDQLLTNMGTGLASE